MDECQWSELSVQGPRGENGTNVCFWGANVGQHKVEMFNNKVLKNESQPCKVLSSPSLEVFKEKFMDHLSAKVMKGIPKLAGSLH